MLRCSTWLLCWLLTSAIAQAEPPAVDFIRDIQPIFETHCVSCHGPEKQKSGLRLDLREAAQDGGDSGPLYVSGKSGESELYLRVTTTEADQRMPPAGEPLTPRQVELLRAWIDAGGQWPELETDTAIPVKSDHWAFQVPQRAALPDVKQAAWVHNPIDRFILARLERDQLLPAPEADRMTLLRRVSLDLLGVLPSPEEAAAFAADPAPDAYERLVERLLASPHFGERWGRHWLDLARYADTNGYERDDPRPNAWRYRDWVIQAINADLPFDRFVTEQLAGDLLPEPAAAQLAAAGFHRMAITNTESGINKEDYRNREVVDRVNTTGTAFLGLTLGCAQCHSHKYDPISQKDYYRFYAFFNNTQEENRTVVPTASEQLAHEVALQAFQQRAARIKEQQAVLDQIAGAGVEQWFDKVSAEASSPSTHPPAERVAVLDEPEELRAALLRPATDRDDAQRALLAEFSRTLAAKREDALNRVRQLSVEEREISQPAVMTVAEKTAERRATHVLLRGDFKQPGPEVTSGTPAALNILQPRGRSPDRLDLAAWINDPSNPLTARVAVNHAWNHLFGRGLVATVDDFGKQGEAPSHPELLDWLAVELRDAGWSRKHLLRLIVTSATYRQSSAYRTELDAFDPQNRLLARQQRLRVEGEVVRDLFLSASGLLHVAVGGPSMRPVAPDAIRDLGYKYQLVWDVSSRPERYRRGLYIHFKRTNPYPSLVMFDAPEATVCTAFRSRSSTPLQALATLNDPVFVECAQALGQRLLQSPATTDVERLQLAGQVTLGRRFSPLEFDVLTQLLAAERARHANTPEAAAALVGDFPVSGVSSAETATWIAVSRALLNLDEFLTRE